MLTISSLSTEYVKVPITATVNGAAYNPTADTVVFAFTTVGARPQTGDWKTGSWETQGTSYLARCLVGPAGAVTLTPGEYTCWVRVTDAPEVPVKNAGQIEVV